MKKIESSLMAQSSLRGIVPAMVTPLDSSGRSVDREAAGRLARFLADSGVHGLFPLGSTGEGVLLPAALRKAMAEAVIEEAGKRIPVIVHIGSLTGAEVFDLADHALAAGASGVAMLPPAYYPLDEGTLERYFAAVAERIAPAPLYLYNLPANVRNSISVSLVGRLAERYPNVAGIKESSMDFAIFSELLRATPSRLTKLIGNDDQILAALAAGGQGAISAGATAIPEPYVALFAAFQRGDLAEARRWQGVCSSVKRLLTRFCPVAPYKKALALRRVTGDQVYAPLRALGPEEAAALERGLAELGYLSE